MQEIKAKFSENMGQPLWSVMITSYDRVEYLEKAIKSVTEQGICPKEMQIEVVNDCSNNSEEIKSIVEEIGKGRVFFFCQSKNVGIFANWNTCIERSKGKWIHILSDDDLVMPGFYETYQHYIESYPCAAILSQSIEIDENEQWQNITPPLQKDSGLLRDPLKKLIKEGNRIRTPGVVVARSTYEKLGGYTTDLEFTADWEMWLRIAMSGENIVYVNRPYSLFRVHGSQTNILYENRKATPDILKLSSIIQSKCTSPEEIQEIKSYFSRWTALMSAHHSQIFLRKKQYTLALYYLIESIAIYPSLFSFKAIALFFAILLKLK